jgi:anti-anti-sigma regulatory factor
MNIDSTQIEGRVPVAVLALDGELDGSNYGELVAQAQESYAAGARYMLIDMSRLTYMSSAGLFALHSIALLLQGRPLPDPEDGWAAFHAVEREQSRGPSQQLKLLSPQPRVVRVLSASGMDQFLEVHQDLQQAIASFQKV